MRYPWPLHPWTMGWRVRATIFLTEADHAALAWLQRQFPAGPPDDAALIRLMTAWGHESWAPAGPGVTHLGWWVFLMVSPGRGLGRLLWQAQMQQITLHRITGDVIIPRLADDGYWQRHPWEPAQWYTACQLPPWPLDEPRRIAVAYQTTVMAWRASFWHQWRQRHLAITGRVQSLTGIPALPRGPADARAWIQRQIFPLYPGPGK